MEVLSFVEYGFFDFGKVVMKGVLLLLFLGVFLIVEVLLMLCRLYKSFLMVGLCVCGLEGKLVWCWLWGLCVWGISLGILGLYFFIYCVN